MMAMAHEKTNRFKHGDASSSSVPPQINEIDLSLLQNPAEDDTYVGRGCFGIVRYQM